MRPERNPLDLNNFPDDSSRDGSKERSRSKDGKEYECRFCSLKFCKSQALGGHMNRHRQERETESLNKARELVFRNGSFPLPASPFCSYHPAGQTTDATLYRPVLYPPRLFTAPASSSSSILQPQPQPLPLPQPCLYPPQLHQQQPSSGFPPYDNPMNQSPYLRHALGYEHSINGESYQITNYIIDAENGSPADPSYDFVGSAVSAAQPPSTTNRFQGNGFLRM